MCNYDLVAWLNPIFVNNITLQKYLIYIYIYIYIYIVHIIFQLLINECCCPSMFMTTPLNRLLEIYTKNKLLER